MKTSSTLAALFGVILVGCAASAETEEQGGTVSNIEQVAPSSKTAPEGAYHRAPEKTRDGVLTITSSLDDAFDFEIVGSTTISEEDGDPGQAGTHEGVVDGTAVLEGDDYVFVGENDCELRFTITHTKTNAVKIAVKQVEDGSCQPNPLVTLNGVYTFAPKALPK